MVNYVDSRGMEEGHLGKNYKLNKWNHDIDKPFVVGFHKEIKQRHFMDPVLKPRKGLPAPNHYKIDRELTFK